MGPFLIWLAGFGIFLALWFWRLVNLTLIERDNARSEAAHWKAVAAHRQRQIVEGWADREMMRREQRLLNDLLAPRQNAKHSPATPATVDELLGATVDEDDNPEAYGV